MNFFYIIALTETWVDTANKNFVLELEIAGYQMLHKDRRGGRVALCTRHSNVPLLTQFTQSPTQNQFGWTSIKGQT